MSGAGESCAGRRALPARSAQCRAVCVNIICQNTGEIAIFKSPFKFLYHPVNGKYEKGNVVLVQISFIQSKAQLR